MSNVKKSSKNTDSKNERRNIELILIDDFPNHPYHICDDADMLELTESIQRCGLLEPLTVRQKSDGRYELIAGHRRKHACEILELKCIDVTAVELNDDEATIRMVDSNCQRSRLLPSEKAFAYKLKFEALKHQGKRNDLTSVQFAQKLEKNTSRKLLAEQHGESEDKIRRYIRLTFLISELLQFVDEGKIKMLPAVEISYIDEETQRDVVDLIDGLEVLPSYSQAVRIRKIYESGNATYNSIKQIMEELKPNQKPKYDFSYERLSKYIPKDYSDKKAEDLIIEALKSYMKKKKNLI